MNKIIIGKYEIRESKNFADEDFLWMVKHDHDGEGMGCDIAKFEKILDDFWDKEF